MSELTANQIVQLLEIYHTKLRNEVLSPDERSCIKKRIFDLYKVNKLDYPFVKFPTVYYPIPTNYPLVDFSTISFPTKVPSGV